MLTLKRRLIPVSSLILLSSVGPAAAQVWTPPLGLPAPAFWITQTAPQAPWTAAVAGFYYVDATASASTDSSNPYGWPAKPRKTIPSSLPAGAVIELHGTYGTAHTSPSNIVAAGTAASPVYIRRASASTRPTITKSWEVNGTYLVMENLTFAFTGPGLYLLAPLSNAALRASELRGNLGDGGIEVVSSGSVSNLVIYGNVIHDNGDVGATYDRDVHGVLVGSQVSNVWIVDNELYRNSGDGAQGSTAARPRPTTSTWATRSTRVGGGSRA
jgi:hypothetical protein